MHSRDVRVSGYAQMAVCHVRPGEAPRLRRSIDSGFGQIGIEATYRQCLTRPLNGHVREVTLALKPTLAITGALLSQ